ncbi:hypothetical protein DAPPUDRAFT_103079 [Daphnia pulex]|uniref:Uncharacterized protein n=1 Tax=Daphnia pulex TaxID=6669 RepID=E9GIC0_DAPPU|nr:hypothetical protein DAPPUDRAFT_103079 [Daphnia pulex]|eukprot:EFX80652.1 hypothetical protein DAPPUDRAFT_103079 [Daphnia pulex]
MRIEKFVLPHPFLPEKSALSTSEDGSPQMVVDSCVESEDQYILQISIHHCDDEISDLKVSTDQRKPCESAHEITLSLSQPNYIKPLLLSFPHPFLVDSIRASLHCAHRSISLVLNKAIQEPWPSSERLVKGAKNSSLAAACSQQASNPIDVHQVIDHTTLPSELEMPVHLQKCRASCVSLPVPSRLTTTLLQPDGERCDEEKYNRCMQDVVPVLSRSS